MNEKNLTIILIAKNKYICFDQKHEKLVNIRYVVFSKNVQNKDLLFNKIFQL